MTRSSFVEVSGPVYAKVDPIHVRLFAYRDDHTTEGIDRPWKMGAMVRITFRIGELKTTKRIRQGYAWTDRLGWPIEKRPSDSELAVARQTVIDNICREILRHNIPAFEIVVIDDPEG